MRSSWLFTCSDPALGRGVQNAPNPAYKIVCFHRRRLHFWAELCVSCNAWVNLRTGKWAMTLDREVMRNQEMVKRLSAQQSSNTAETRIPRPRATRMRSDRITSNTISFKVIPVCAQKSFIPRVTGGVGKVRAVQMEPLGVGMRSAESSPFSASFTFIAFNYFTSMILFTIRNKYSKSDSSTKLTTFPLALAVCFFC